MCRPHRGAMIDLIKACGYEVCLLPELVAQTSVLRSRQEAGDDLYHSSWLGTSQVVDAQDTKAAIGKYKFDWLVVDHYALDFRWENLMRDVCERLMVIDDLADRFHVCDLLIDQNLGRRKRDYVGLVSNEADVLVGPKFALLRPEFYNYRPVSLARRKDPTLKNIFVNLGGVDKDNITKNILEALERSDLPSDMCVTVVMGKYAPFINVVKGLVSRMRFDVHVSVNVSNMASIMTYSDLAFGAAGSSAWERCCLGLPSFLSVLAENQREIATALEACGAALVIRDNSVVALTKIVNEVVFKGQDGLELERMALASSRVTDGLGAYRVLNKLSC